MTLAANTADPLIFCMSAIWPQQVDSLQRECNEAAAELARLRAGEAGRLPSVNQRPVSLQDELDNLKRWVCIDLWIHPLDLTRPIPAVD